MMLFKALREVWKVSDVLWVFGVGFKVGVAAEKGREANRDRGLGVNFAASEKVRDFKFNDV